MGAWADGPTRKGKIAAEQPSWIPPMLAATTSTNWTGGYVGVHGASGPYSGGGDGSWDTGGQVGYNWHWQPGVVLGFEVDASKTWWKEQFQVGYSQVTQEIEWSGSARVRAGWATSSILAYATGGVGVQYIVDTAVKGESLVRDQGFAAPWVYGVGAELRATERVSVKAEFLRFQGEAFELDVAPIDRDVFRLGLNYKLN